MGKYEGKGNKSLRDNIDDKQKEHLKIEAKKRKKEKGDNLYVDEKEHLRKYEKKGKKLCVKTSMRKKNL